MMRHMSASAWMCYTLICRRTIGWHKCADVISNSQFCTDTGLSKTTVIRALKELATLGVVEMTPTKIHGQPANQYTVVGLSIDSLGSIEFIPPSIKSIPPSAKLIPPSIKIDTEVVSKLYTQKKDIQKKQIKKEREGAPKVRDPALDSWQVITYQQIAKRHIPVTWRQKVIDTVTDEHKWKSLLVQWIGSGWNIGNISGILQRYEGAHHERRATRQDASGGKPPTSNGLTVREYLESEGFTGFQ
jgi:hypothetical protein